MPFESSSSSFSPEITKKHKYLVPKNYKLLKVLGNGCYGTVLECVKNGSEEHVAIKVPKIGSLGHEASILKKLMHHNLDKCNIIKYKGDVFVRFRRLLKLEKLDIALEDYQVDLKEPMRLEGIRTIIQQMAVALDALKSIGVIHTDLKTDNIMMVDRVKQPFRVKLSDFGLAMFRFEAKAGQNVQPLPYRAPEIILGLPFSEAIDVWSLGCVLAQMVAGVFLFGSQSEYCILQNMIRLLGPPPQHFIQAGQKSERFFNRLPCGVWQLKTPVEYYGNYNTYIKRRGKLCFLDELKKMRLEKDNPAEADERRECIELLRAMFRWDEKDRITPSGILNHPFITKSFLNSSSHLSSCNEPELPTSQIIMVQPADRKNRINLAGISGEDSDLEDDDNGENIKNGKKNANTENRQDRKNMEDNKNSVNKKISVNEYGKTVEDTEDRNVSENSSDNEDSWTSEVRKDKNKYRDVKQNCHDNKHKEDNKKEQKKTKKKKNCFRRFFSWMKKTFCSCAVHPM